MQVAVAAAVGVVAAVSVAVVAAAAATTTAAAARPSGPARKQVTRETGNNTAGQKSTITSGRCESISGKNEQNKEAAVKEVDSRRQKSDHLRCFKGAGGSSITKWIK